MDADERDICNYLKSWPGQFVFGRDVARHAGGKYKYRENHDWAAPVLQRLVEQGIIESDSTGHFRLKISSRKEKSGKFLSPHIKKILEKSSKDFSQLIEIEDPDDPRNSGDTGAGG